MYYYDGTLTSCHKHKPISQTSPSFTSLYRSKPNFVQSLCVSAYTCALTSRLPCWVTNCSAKEAITQPCSHRHWQAPLCLTWAEYHGADGQSKNRFAIPNSCARLRQLHRYWLGMHVKNEPDQNKRVLTHPCAQSNPPSYSQYSTIAGTELSDSVCSAGSLLSQNGFPWMDFKGKIQRAKRCLRKWIYGTLFYSLSQQMECFRYQLGMFYTSMWEAVHGKWMDPATL